MSQGPDGRRSRSRTPGTRKRAGRGAGHGRDGGERVPVREPMQDLRPTVWIGKSGCTDTIIAEITAQLEHRKQVKVKWLRNTEISPAEVAARAGAVLIEVRGRTMVLAKRRIPGRSE